VIQCGPHPREHRAEIIGVTASSSMLEVIIALDARLLEPSVGKAIAMAG
jgi:hypothetical protein